MNCNNCKFWGDHTNPMPRELEGKGYSACVRIPSPSKTFRQDAIIYTDDPYVFSQMYTKWNFGCKLFKEKE